MPSTPRGRDAATLLAVLLAIALALLWLRTSDGAAPAVPDGLSVPSLPAVAPEEPANPDEASPPARGIEGGRAGGGRGAVVQKTKRRRADRAGGREDARPPTGGGWARTRSGTAGEAGGQDPPATALEPSVGSSGTSALSGGASEPAPPEFALE